MSTRPPGNGTVVEQLRIDDQAQADDPLRAEAHHPHLRLELLRRMWDRFSEGYRDLELLYRGARFAASLNMPDAMGRFLEPLAELLGDDHPVVGELRSYFSEPRSGPVQAFVDAAACGRGPTAEQAPWNDDVQRLADCARAATDAYARQQYDDARAALARMLTLRPDSPDVVRNALVVAAEQRDAEAYARYWRRHVRLRLCAWLNRCDAGEAIALRQFYVRAATKADEAYASASLPDRTKLLGRSGFVRYWLECHLGLAWLGGVESAMRRDWLQFFYPDFAPHVARLPAHSPAPLPFDPVERLVRRYFEWASMHFGSLSPTHPDFSFVRSMSIAVARLPDHHLMPEALLAVCKPPAGERLNRVVQQSLTLPWYAGLESIMGQGEGAAPDWPAVVDRLGSVALLARVEPSVRLYAAMGLLRMGRYAEGVGALCSVLGDLDASHVDDVDGVFGLFQSALAGPFAEADSAVDPSWLRDALESLATVQVAPRAKELRRRVVSMVEDLLGQLDARSAFEQWHVFMKEERPADARACLASLPQGNEAIEEQRLQMLESTEALELQLTVNQIEALLKPPSDEGFAAALAALRALQLTYADVVKSRDKMLKQLAAQREQFSCQAIIERWQSALKREQIREAHRQIARLPRGDKEIEKHRIDMLKATETVEFNLLVRDIQSLLGSGDLRRIDEAVRRVKSFRPKMPDAVDAKASLLDQLSQQASMHEAQQAQEQAVEDLRRRVERADFVGARRAIDRLVAAHPVLAESAQHMREQVQQAERASKAKAQIDAGLKTIGEALERRDVQAARRAWRGLPDIPEFAQVKAAYGQQIDSFEEQLRQARSALPALQRRLSGKGLDSYQIREIARQNDIDITDDLQHFQLLEALLQQVRRHGR